MPTHTRPSPLAHRISRIARCARALVAAAPGIALTAALCALPAPAASAQPASADLVDADLRLYGFSVHLDQSAAVYTQRSGARYDLTIDGGLPAGWSIDLRAWDVEAERYDEGFDRTLDGRPFRISPRQMDNLEPGSYLLQARVSHGDRVMQVIEHAVEVLPPAQGARHIVPGRVKFDDVPGTYELDSGVSMPLRVGRLGEGEDIVLLAYSHKTQSNVSGFRHVLDASPWTIDSQYLDRLPEGDVTLQAVVRRDRRAVRVVEHELSVRDVDSSTNSGGFTGNSGITFPGNTPTEYQQGSGQQITFNAPRLANDKSILVRAYNLGSGSFHRAFDFTIDNTGPFRITGNQLDTLPAGDTQLQLLVRQNGRTIDRITHRVNIVARGGGNNGGGNGGNNNGGDTNLTVQPGNWAAAYTRNSGLNLGFTVSGQITPAVDVLVMAWDVDRRRKVDWFQHTLTNGNWSIDSAQLDRLPEGPMSIQMLARVNGESVHMAQRTINMQTGTGDNPGGGGNGGGDNGNNGPWDVAFPGNFPATYTLGSGTNLPIQITGNPPADADVLLLAWHNDQSRGITAYTHTVAGNPWVVRADKLDTLPTGSVTLQLVQREGRESIDIVQQRITIVAGNGNGGGNGGGGNNGGGDGGNNGGDTGGGGGQPDAGDWQSDDLPAQSDLMGMNLSFINFFNREWVFADLMKQSRPWMIHRNGWDDWNSEGDYPVDANGWPVARGDIKPFTIMSREMSGNYPGGRYEIRWDGDGDIVVGLDARVVSREGNVLQVDVEPTQLGIYLRVDRSNGSNPVRNIEVLTPAGVDGHTFHPLFLHRLGPIKTIRFMDWQNTNNSETVSWNGRTTPQHCTMDRPEGVALEYMIQLCNELDADMWVCMPHLADDNFVRNFAQMVERDLEPGRKVYVEWSNEVWNGLFDQHHWVHAVKSGGRDFWREWAYQVDRDFAIWTQVFNGQTHRMRRVLASQTMNPWVTQQLSNFLQGRFDVIATNAYVDVPAERLYNGITTDVLMDLMAEDLQTRLVPKYNETSAIARDWSRRTGRNIEWVVYEGGQHLTTYGANKPWLTTFHEAQYHPRMYDIIQQNLFEFEKAGGTAFMNYSYVSPPNNFGSWGHLTYQNQPIEESVKFRALMEYLDSDLRLSLSSFD